jgi:large subunit ribosomal protein L25
MREESSLQLIELKTNIRNTRGNGPARQLRRTGRIPAVLYGPGSEPTSLSIDHRELEAILKHNKASQVVLSLVMDDTGATKNAMIRELQTDPLSGAFLHADFYEVAMDRTVHTKVPVATTGKSIGVEMGGMLQIIRRELEVLCYPDRIPQSIVIDITDLELGGAVHVEDIQLGEDIEIPHDVNFTILTVLGRKAEATAEEEAEEGEEEVAGEAAAE